MYLNKKKHVNKYYHANVYVRRKNLYLIYVPHLQQNQNKHNMISAVFRFCSEVYGQYQTIDIPPQRGNHVSSEMRMILFQWSLLQQLQPQSQIRVEVTSENQLKISGSSEQERDQIMTQISTMLDKLFILQYPCKTENEAKIKTILLQNEVDSMAERLDCQNIKIVSFANLTQQQAGLQDAFIDSPAYCSAKTMLFVLAFNHSNQKINRVQEKLLPFIEEKIKIRKNEQLLSLSFKPSIELLEEKIVSMSQFLQFAITGPDLDNQTNRYALKINYCFLSSQKQQAVDIEQIKQGISEFLNPVQYVELSPKTQPIWEFIKKNFSQQSLKGNAKVTKVDEQIQISGDRIFVEEYKDQIIKQLNLYKVSETQCKVNNTKIMELLKNKNLDKLFQKDLEQIEKALQLTITIHRIDVQSQSFIYQCIYQNDISELDLQKQLSQNFTSKLELYQINYLKEIIKFNNMEITHFEYLYSCALGPLDAINGSYIICTNQNKERIQPLVEKFIFHKSQKNIKIDIQQQNPIVLKQMGSFINQNLPNIKHKVIEDKIQLIGLEKNAVAAKSIIESEIIAVQSRYFKQKVDLTHKEVIYFKEFLQESFKKDIQDQENCKITFQEDKFIQEQTLMTLNVQNIQFNIIYGDISQFKTEAIVNSCNQKLDFDNHTILTGVARKLFEKGGPEYQKTCQDYLIAHKQLQFGQVLPFKCNQGAINYIFSVATPIYSESQQIDNDLQIITKNIIQLFKTANQLKIKEITLPLFGAGASGYQIDQLVQTVLNAIKEALCSFNATIQTVNIIELDLQKVYKTIEIANQIIFAKPIRQIQYQWQWKDKEFKNYDDDHINQQIDIAYEQYLKDKSKKEVRLIFPCSKLPGTHKVDLKTNVLTDIALSKTQKITQSLYNGVLTYHFDLKPVPVELNEFMFLQQASENMDFTIFYKRHKVIFSDTKIQQINEETNFVREVQFIPYQKPQQVNQQSFINTKDFKLKQYKVNNELGVKSQLILEIISKDKFYHVSNLIQSIIRSNLVELSIKIPYLKDAELNILRQFIEKISHSIKDQIIVNQQVSLSIFRHNKDQLLDYLQTKLPQYPDSWEPQSVNFAKVNLSNDHAEYQKIEKQFQATNPKGKVHKIYRIQNKLIWDNYIYERNRLLELKVKQNIQLTQDETERYLWHGVKAQHPQIIYSKEKEAFDASYSRKDCYWGEAAYFAEQAIYSYPYSHKLTAVEDASLEGKPVFLCCLITTGKVNYLKDRNPQLKRPAEGFDCVSGFTDGSQVYMLYGNDVRRAYPAYEVVYEQIP